MSNSFTVAYNAGGTVDKVKNIKQMDNVDNINLVQKVDEIGFLGGIRGFATKTQPYNTMRKIDIPAGVPIVEEELELPSTDIEILAMSVTCSGYGEDDNYDLWINDQLIFDRWYCSEVKEGLFLGTSNYVYATPADSRIRIKFYNTSSTSKKLWVGVRMLVDPVVEDEEEQPEE